MRSSQRAVIGLVAALAVAASLFAPVSGAVAAAPISGVLLDAGTPVSGALIYVLRRDNAQSAWISWDFATTNGSGAWSYSANTVGDYALYYTLSSTAVIYAANQTTGGLNSYLNAPADFSYAGGSPSAATFNHTLLRNAGALQVTLTDAAGTTLTSDGVNGYGSVGMVNGYSDTSGVISVNPAQPSMSENHPVFDGTIVVPRIPAGFWTNTNVTATGAVGNVTYKFDTLDGVAIVAGQTLNYGSFAMAPNGSAAIAFPLGWAPVITGVAKVGAVLTAVTAPIDGSVSMQWLVNGINIPGATSATFAIAAKNLGQQFSVLATVRKAGSVSSARSSSSTLPVVLGDPSALVVSITGDAKYGGVLRAAVASPLGGATTFRWYRNATPIPDADGSTFTVGKTDIGTTIYVSATTTVQGHNDAVIPSAAVAISKEIVTLKAKTDRTITTKTKPKVKVTVRPSASTIGSTAKVRVFYTKTRFKSVTVKSGKSVTVKLPRLKKGTTTLRVVYPGTAFYDAKTVTIKVKVRKK